MDDNQSVQYGYVRLGQTEDRDYHPFDFLANGLQVILEGEGKEGPEKWKFLRRTLVFVREAPDGCNEDTSVTVSKTFLNKKPVKYKITVIYNGNSNDIFICCDKLIDHAIQALSAGEDLRLELNEIKEEFINDIINKQKALDNLKKEMLIKIDNARGPDDTNLVPLTLTSSTRSVPFSFTQSLDYSSPENLDSYVDQAQQRSYNENN